MLLLRRRVVGAEQLGAEAGVGRVGGGRRGGTDAHVSAGAAEELGKVPGCLDRRRHRRLWSEGSREEQRGAKGRETEEQGQRNDRVKGKSSWGQGDGGWRGGGERQKKKREQADEELSGPGVLRCWRG